MFKRIFAAVMLLLIAISISSCSVDKQKTEDDVAVSAATTQKVTVIYNDLKDVLPDFKFDGEPVEKYREGVSYTFSAVCSESDCEKYIKKVKKAGFEENAVEAKGYYAAYNEENFYVEITLVGDLITVYIKRA